MGEKLSWKEIKVLYDKQWVELIDYDWPQGTPHPKSGVVRVHSSDRNEFYSLANVNPPHDSAIVFVGKISLPSNVILSSSVMHIRNANR